MVLAKFRKVRLVQLVQWSEQKISQKVMNLLLLTDVASFITDVIDSWNRDEFFFQKLPFSKWELTIPALEGGLCRIQHGSSLKVF